MPPYCADSQSGVVFADHSNIFNFTVVGEAPGFASRALRTITGWQAIYRVQSVSWLTVFMNPADRQLSGNSTQRPVQLLRDTLCAHFLVLDQSRFRRWAH
jgi:hypothetical protein